MIATIVDMTSLIELSSDWNRGNDTKNRVNTAITSNEMAAPGIEALVLFENILVDKASFVRSVGQYPRLKKLETHIDFVNGGVLDEKGRYEEAIEFINDHLESNDSPVLAALTSFLEQRQSYPIACGTWPLTPFPFLNLLSVGLSTIARQNTPVRKSLLEKLKDYIVASGYSVDDIDEDTWIKWLRLFYYLTTQAEENVHLSLHPMKAALLSPFAADDVTNHSVSKAIIDNFDRRVRKSYLLRRKAWLGDRTPRINMPLLENYIRSEQEKGVDPIDAALQLRDSKEARLFRKEVGNIVDAIDANNHREIDTILARLDDECNKWSLNLNYNPRRSEQTMGLTLPVVGISIDVPFLAPKFRKRPGDAILIFLHKLASTI